MKTTIGGDRLGSGNKQEVQMRNYERSTHDLSFLWRSSMASGTLVPFMSEVGLSGDSFDINLNCEVMTLPTIGPLFGSYKVQLDVFSCPIRLYQGKLHMNKLGIGMDMKQIKLPQMQLEAWSAYNENHDDNEQINPSCILSYLNIRGLGIATTQYDNFVHRNFNALPFLSYWDIYKQYYANKQEERGFVIHNNIDESGTWTIDKAEWYLNGNPQGNLLNETQNIDFDKDGDDITIVLTLKDGKGRPNFGTPFLNYGVDTVLLYTISAVENWNEETNEMSYGRFNWSEQTGIYVASQTIPAENPVTDGKPQLVEFPLENIDTMREKILMAVQDTSAFYINDRSGAPYEYIFKQSVNDPKKYSKQSTQEGLGLKTYQSDLFNNWISTEWIDGTNGINEVTAVSTTGDSFTIDALNLANKVYNMLNRIAISGGSYDDWLDAVYTHERAKSVESPIYMGSLIKELGFEEVISNARSESTTEGTQPLGELAGRGRLTGKHKGGKIRIKVDEPSYIMGIVSLTPRVDYSQGNKWDTNLKTMDDFHKPALDEIGYQDLITDQMAWFDTVLNDDEVIFKSAGKQPAWINYMTNVNQVRGNFADIKKEMFMTLNRRYESDGANGIKDLTTYIDPSKFNQIFADSRLDAQNFWVQISADITARRKMSAKVIPNL